MRGPRPRWLAVVVAVAAVLVLPGLARAHPLGNFMINHYAGVRIEPDRILLDVVIDEAEIPTFEARLAFDTDGDGDLSDDEIDAGRLSACRDLAGSLSLTVAGGLVEPVLGAAGLSFPPGIGGLSTMRIVCEYAATLPAPITEETTISFVDRSQTDRIGWREIVATGSGVTLQRAGPDPLRSADVSRRLTAYPTALIPHPLHDAGLEVTAVPGGPVSAVPPPVGDAQLVAAPAPGPDRVGGGAAPASVGPAPAAPVAGAPVATLGAPAAAPDAPLATAAAVPGGVSDGDLPSIFRATDLTPTVLLVSLLTAIALGAGHALSPGHGKTLMAAYLVGTRGTPLHAAGLGLSVTVSHTLGILVLAGLVVGAEDVLPADVVARDAPVVAAASFLVIGGWMLAGELRRRRRHPDHVDHDLRDDGVHAHPHPHPHPTSSTISWRGLAFLGLAGGLIPSTSALLILLGSIAAGRPAFGVVLVVAFGLGMAIVMTGIGLGLVLARGRLDRVAVGRPFGRLGAAVPMLAACLVILVGLVLTIQAVGPPAL